MKYVLILTALASFLFFFKLGSFSLYDAAETTYGEFIKQIRLTGDWFTMHYNGQIIFDKPPLYFWLATLATYLLGFNEFAIRFWAAVSGVLTVLTTYFLGKKFYHEKVGFLAAAVVMTAFQFIVQARIAELDMLLTLLLTLALFCFYLSYQSPNKNYYLLSYFFMGLATLVKGVIGVVLPLFTIFIFLFTKKELKRIREMKLMWGIIIIAIVSLPWFLSEYFLHGKVFLDFIFGFLFLSRFQTVVSGHPGPWYYYLFALLLGFAPWSAFLPYALWQTWENRNHNSELLTLCYLLPPFIVFSLAKTKLPNYILPFYPFFAIIVGKIWYDFLSKPK
ncbi:MAG: ArnT family glycosyltransferase, partial [Candidatus Margulisiibacteriota bacterium]